MATNGTQTCLEKRGMSERNEEVLRNDYNKENEYSSIHENATSNGTSKGKGTNHGGHGHWLPDCSKPTNTIDYSNFDTENGGNCYDINGRNGVGGRNWAKTNSMYNEENPYGANSVDTSANINDGQYYFGQRIGNATTC